MFVATRNSIAPERNCVRSPFGEDFVSLTFNTRLETQKPYRM